MFCSCNVRVFCCSRNIIVLFCLCTVILPGLEIFSSNMNEKPCLELKNRFDEYYILYVESPCKWSGIIKRCFLLCGESTRRRVGWLRKYHDISWNWIELLYHRNRFSDVFFVNPSSLSSWRPSLRGPYCSGLCVDEDEEECELIREKLENIDHVLDEHGIVFVATHELEVAKGKSIPCIVVALRNDLGYTYLRSVKKYVHNGVTTISFLKKVQGSVSKGEGEFKPVWTL